MAKTRRNLTLDSLTPSRIVVDVRQSIRDRLKTLKWSRHRLAKEIGMRVSTVYDCLADEGNPKLDTVERMLSALGLELRVVERKRK